MLLQDGKYNDNDDSSSSKDRAEEKWGRWKEGYIFFSLFLFFLLVFKIN